MKKSKIFLTTGTLVLAVSAIFATKAAKKFASVTTALQASGQFIVKSGSSFLMTTKKDGNQLQLNIAGTVEDLITATDSHAVYFKP
jgi:phosphotransferase system HPr-like phosphotransfer protein